MKPTSSRLIPNSTRIAQRDTPGSLTSVHEAALLELAAGNLKNAWALLQESLGVALLYAWRDVCGRPTAQGEDRQSLLLKLYNRKAIDKWTLQLVKEAMKHPHGYDYRRLDLLAGIVRSFVFDKPAVGVDEATETLKAYSASEPEPAESESRDPRQVEEWLPVPAAEPLPEPTIAPSAPAPKTNGDLPAGPTVPVEDERARYLPTEAEIERECRKILASRYPTFPLTDDQYSSPHWREHEARLAAIGVR